MTIADDREERRVAAKDIFVLTRSGAESAELGSYLREAGVPFAFYKQHGLFQTNEAFDVLDLLNAINEPGSQSRRLKAWVSPFFAVPFARLFGFTAPPPGHPLNERLYEWKALADEERFAELFQRLQHETGLVSRELFLSNSERELTNYSHIFEILLELALKQRLSLDEIIGSLESFIFETALPAGADSNIQRLESDRSAVQVMSVHMSKGLEADVVFLFGGMMKPPNSPLVCVYHEDYERRIAVGKTAKQAVENHIEREERQENQRLVYVALTRARARLYLPVFPDDSTPRRINGYYTPLNQRLKELLADREGNQDLRALFAVEDVREREPGTDAAALSDLMRRWSPPDALIRGEIDHPPASGFAQLRLFHSPLVTRSYTSLEARGGTSRAEREIESEEFKYDLEVAAEAPDLRGGRKVGIFLHEVIEKVALESFATEDLGSWRARDDIRRLFTESMRRHQVRDPRWFERGTEIVFNALTSRLATGAATVIGPLYRCPSVRELEFVYPIPEKDHRLLEAGGDGAWRVERGYLKGFVDFFFEHDNLFYFADWKSDLLDSYSPAAIRTHVSEHYDLQARIYSVGIIRLLRIRNREEYQRRFGGLLYLFIRGIRRDLASAQGVYFHRPEWEEIARYEKDLIETVPPTASAR